MKAEISQGSHMVGEQRGERRTRLKKRETRSSQATQIRHPFTSAGSKLWMRKIELCEARHRGGEMEGGVVVVLNRVNGRTPREHEGPVPFKVQTW